MTVTRRWTTWALIVAAVAVGSAFKLVNPPPPPIAITVWKSPTCGCCAKWIDHLNANGFKVTTRNLDDVTPIKNQNHVPENLRSCHTAVVNGYVIEGHVPAADIQHLLRDHPKVVGLAVPGMVTGSPGMEGGTAQAYDVVSFGDGKTAVYAKH
jgi:hypothetical protein